MITNTESKLSPKFFLLFIPVAFFTYLFHEFGHWIGGEAFGNRMLYSLNGVTPLSGQFIEPTHEIYSSIGGPAFTILLSLFFWLMIEKYKTIYAYAFVFFQLFCRFFSLVFGGFEFQDEAGIARLLSLGKYSIAIIVLLILLLIVLRASHVLKINFQKISYVFTVSTVCNLLVIATSRLIS